MPSTISTSVSSDLASSTVMTPSLPTFCIASAIILPIFLSPFDEMVPTWATSADEPTFLARFSMSLMTAATAMSMPRLRSIGFMPAATDLAPSLTIAAASTVAVVVPSPALSLVFWATSRTICAPMFSNLSSSSISLATVTPSLVMRGAPNDLSITTLRPLGPSVTFTALASISTPRSIRSRASVEKRTSLADISIHSSREFGCWTFRRSTPMMSDSFMIRRSSPSSLTSVPDHLPNSTRSPALTSSGIELAGFVAAARADGDDLALRRLLLGGVGDDDAAGGLLLGVDTLDDHAVVQGTELEFGHVFLVGALAQGG